MEFKVPLSLVSRGDTARIMRELNGFIDYLVGADYRHEEAEEKLRAASPLLQRIATDNKLDLLDEKQCRYLYEILQKVFKEAPSLHISFTRQPSAKALEKIVLWMRTNIHPQMLLQVGMQPNLIAGSVLRTPNKVFDMSLRETLNKQQPLLFKLLQGTTHE